MWIIISPSLSSFMLYMHDHLLDKLAGQLVKKLCILVSKHETWHDCSQRTTTPPKELVGHFKNSRWPPLFKMAVILGLNITRTKSI